MIQAVKLVNHINESLELELRRPEDTGFLITSITGLGYPKIDFSEQKYSNQDGSYYSAQRVQPRNIVMNVTFYQNNKENLDIETLRWKWQRFLIIKSELKFYVHNDHGWFWTKGFVESNEINIFSSMEAAQLSILCPDPYFVEDLEENTVTIGLYEPEFEFPFSSEMHDLSPDNIIRTEKTATTPYMSLDVDDYYNIIYQDNGCGKLPKRYNRVGQLATFVFGSEKLIETIEPTEVTESMAEGASEGFTYRIALPENYPGGDDIYFKNTFVKRYDNDAGGYTARAEYATDGIEFGHIKKYPSTTIDYTGSAVTGVKIIVEAKTAIRDFRIDNYTRKEKIIVDDKILNRITGYIRNHDELIFDTTRGQKSAFLVRNGISYNILNACLPIKDWIQLQTGPNVIAYSSSTDIELADVRMEYPIRYLGV